MDWATWWWLVVLVCTVIVALMAWAAIKAPQMPDWMDKLDSELKRRGK